LFDFGSIASEYDQWFYTPLGRVYGKLETRALNRFLPSAASGNILLDAGCGTGYWSEHFSALGFRIYGVDISPEMIDVAQRKSIPNTDFIVGDITNLPFPNEYFDVVTAITVLEFVDEPLRVVQEMVRCVKKNGIILIAVLNESSPLARKRKRQGDKTFQNADMFNREKLYKVLSFMKKIEIKTTTFVFPYPGFIWAHPLTEFLGNKLNWHWGDFIIGKALR